MAGSRGSRGRGAAPEEREGRGPGTPGTALTDPPAPHRHASTGTEGSWVLPTQRRVFFWTRLLIKDRSHHLSHARVGPDHPAGAPGPRSSSRWPIVERSPRRSHPFILLYPIRIHRTRKPRPCLARTRPRARVPSCPARGGRRPRGDARTSGVRAQPRNALTHACQQPQALGEGRAKPHQVRLQVRAYCLHTPEGAEIR